MGLKNNYECMFILLPTLSKDDTDKLIERFQAIITGAAGEVAKVERMGKRKLSYEIAGQQEGFYVLLQFKTEGSVVFELERQMRLTDQVMKFQTLIQQPVRQLKIKAKKVKAPAEGEAQAVQA